MKRKMTIKKPRQTKSKVIVSEPLVENEVLETEKIEEVEVEEELYTWKKKDYKPKIYYFAVEGYLNEEGEEIKTSFPSMNDKFDCEWDRMSLIDRAALKHYLNIKGKENKDLWPLNFKFYIDPKSKAVYECTIELDYSPAFLEVNKKEI